MNLAPVADINSNPKNPIINNRSFGEDSQLVSELSDFYMRGLQENGVLACANIFQDMETQTKILTKHCLL